MVDHALCQGAPRHSSQPRHVLLVVPAKNFFFPARFGIGFDHVVVQWRLAGITPFDLQDQLQSAHLHEGQFGDDVGPQRLQILKILVREVFPLREGKVGKAQSVMVAVSDPVDAH